MVRQGCFILVLLIASVGSVLAGNSADDPGLLALIPADAFFVIERPGYDATRGAMAATNLGRLTANPMIQRFLRDSALRIETMLIRELLDVPRRGADPAEIERYRRQFHDVLVPMARKPAALFVRISRVGGHRNRTEPGVGIMVLTGEHRAAASSAITELMAVNIAGVGQEGNRHAFTYESGLTRWSGVASRWLPFVFPEDPAQQIEMLRTTTTDALLFSWTGDMLCIATSLDTADAISRVLTGEGTSLQSDPDMQTVMAKTPLADWELRWYFGIDKLLKTIAAIEGDPMPDAMTAIGLDRICAVGGSEGYADGVYTTLSYLHAPEADRGLPRLLKRGGDYASALAMAPDTAGAVVAGQLDTQVLLRMIREVALATDLAHAPPIATRPAEGETDPATQVVDTIETLLADSGGHIVLYMTNIQSMLMGAATSGGGFDVPIGAIIATSNATEAIAALQSLGGNEDEGDNARHKNYRGVKIRMLSIDIAGEPIRAVAMDDRLILAFGDMAAVAAIDAALDNRGGIPARGDGRQLLALAGEGSAVARIGVPGLVRTGLSLIPDMSGDQDFPLASIPPAVMLAGLLSEEIAVIEPETDGILMRSRGTLPLVSKISAGLPAYSLIAYSFLTHW